MIYYANIQDNLVQGFYCKEIHGDKIPETTIPISEDLWQELLKMGQAEVIDAERLNIPTTLESSEEEFVYGVEYVDCFATHINPMPKELSNYVPVETRVNGLESKVDKIISALEQLMNKN